MMAANRASESIPIRRWAATTLLFTAYVWGLLLLTLPPLWVALSVLPDGRLPDRLLRWCARLVIRLSRCRLRVRGIERLQRCGPAMLVANHASYLDSLVLMAAIPVDYRFVVNHRAVTWPLIGLAIRKVGHLVVDRTNLTGRRACALAMRETLRQGMSVLVFPEGTIHRNGDLLPFRPGAFRIAVEVGRPVVPISLRGTRHVLPDGPRVFRRGSLDVTIHEPVEPVENRRQEAIRLRDCARREIVRGVSET
jgi:1-acyl-sn-glycerol-3-phosphate acyltransferase